MKVKYYLRGLGVGIVVTAILLGRGDSGKTESLSNDEVIRRAKELGMIESTLLSDSVSENATGELEEESEDIDASDVLSEDSLATVSENVQPAVSANDTVSGDKAANKENVVSGNNSVSGKSSENSKVDSTIPDSDNEVVDNSVNEDEEPATVADNPGSATGESVVIVVNGGEGSYTVCKKLLDAGLIKDAKAYDVYLSKNGYDKKITTGSHTIQVGATEEEIAKAITGR